MFHSFMRLTALSFALSSLASAALSDLVSRQTGCATGLHLMIAGGCSLPCAFDEDSLLQTLINNITTAFPGSDTWLVPYDDSPIQGAVSTPLMIQAANDYFGTCPDTPVVFIGYSLGGIIVMNTLCGGLTSNSTPNVLAAITYGEETFRYPQPYDAGTCTESAPLYPRNNTAQCAPFAPAIQNYCNYDDSKCCAGGHGLYAHFAYPNDYDVAATNFIKARYAAADPVSSSSSSSSVAATSTSSSSTSTTADSTTTTDPVSASTTSTASASSTVSTTVSASDSTTTVSVSISTTVSATVVPTTGVSTSVVSYTGVSTTVVSSTGVSTTTVSSTGVSTSLSTATEDSTTSVSTALISTTDVYSSEISTTNVYTSDISTTATYTTLVSTTGALTSTVTIPTTVAVSTLTSTISLPTSVSIPSASYQTASENSAIPVSAIEYSSSVYTSLLSAYSSSYISALSSAAVAASSGVSVAASSAPMSVGVTTATTTGSPSLANSTYSASSATVTSYTGGAARLPIPAFAYLQAFCRVWKSVASLVV